MRVLLPILLSLLIATSASAQSLSDRAAKVFASACLSDPVLVLGNGSDAGEGALAAKYAGDVFYSFEKKGLTAGLVGTPEWTLPANGDTARFFCSVASKDLALDDLVKFFPWLVKTAGAGASPTQTGRARWDTPSDWPLEGKRAEFVSSGRKLIIEAFRFVSPKGPVGGFSISIEHRASH